MQDLIEQIRLRLDEKRRELDATIAKLPAKYRDCNPVYPPVQASTLLAAESRLGFTLPPLLRELYLQVSNGRFGPNRGISGLEGGYPIAAPWANDDTDIVEAYLATQEAGYDDFVPREIVICDWGGGSGSAVDCSTPEGEMVYLREGLAFREGITFRQWMEDWLNGVDLEERALNCKSTERF
jgi:hypothetical protein